MAIDDSHLYHRTRWKIFVSLFIGYSFYYCTRKTFTFSIPALIKSLQLSKDSQYKLGLITSCYTFSYGLSKFVAGFLSDRLSSRAVFTTGLVLSGLINVSIGFYHNLWVLMILWGANGLVQGLGWPPCAALLKKWFKPTELGTLWSVLTSSTNLTASVLPMVTSYLLLNYGLSSAFIIPGSIAMALSVPIYITIVNSPSELHCSTEDGELHDHSKNEAKSQQTDEEPSVMIVFKYPFFWIISVGFFAVSFVKFAIADWGQLYLMQEKRKSLYEAGFAMGMFEIGGFIGCALSGYVSDRLVTKNPASTSSPRLPVVIINLLGLTGSLYLLHTVNVSSSKVVLCALMLAIGCTTMGPINIFGVLAVENSPTSLTSTTHGFVALAASIGATSSGYPLSIWTRYYDWSGMMMALQVVSLLTLIVIVLTRNLNCSMDAKEKRE